MSLWDNIKKKLRRDNVLFAFFNDGVDKYVESAATDLKYLRRYCIKKYGKNDLDFLYVQIGKRLQRYIDAMNNQGGLDAHRHALARWQMYKALYPEYVSDTPPKFVRAVHLDPL